MKIHKYFYIFIFFLLIVPNIIYAANEASPSSNPNKNKQIEDLKERLATKVAQLRQFERKAVSGTVKSISVASITVETQTKELKIELTDDIKVYQMVKGKRTSLTTDDINKGDLVTLFGQYDSTLDVLKAQIVIIQNQIPVRISGIIKSNDSKNYTLSISSPGDLSNTVDFETSTKAFEFIKDQNSAKIGFSKLISGNFVSVLGYPVPKKENQISAARIFIINPNPIASPTINIIATPSATLKSTISPSAKPTIKPTAKPTLKPTAAPAN
jgi:hypothetical protein